MGNLENIPVASIIDDDESVRIATKSLLSSLGWAVRTFASAEEYLESRTENDTSCLIVDIQMPGISGVDLQSVLTKRGYSTPIIFITAFPDDGIKRRALQAGAISFLTKPFDEMSLIECLEKVLTNGSNAEGRQ
jgi:FixJ family two-component response regulator